jgi:hypothetical protein
MIYTWGSTFHWEAKQDHIGNIFCPGVIHHASFVHTQLLTDLGLLADGGEQDASINWVDHGVSGFALFIAIFHFLGDGSEFVTEDVMEGVL